nr:hypothetical protein [uncultured bacterium]
MIPSPIPWSLPGSCFFNAAVRQLPKRVGSFPMRTAAIPVLPLKASPSTVLIIQTP